ncbi:MAG TPA: hypothetical protein VHW65_04875 [Gemmatimonadales bacterium]|nr:hypothetical protein [Gemmatimonadales bacterium]
MASIANPLRIPGLARIAVGAWFIVSGVRTPLRDDYLIPQAERLFNGNPGTTDAPLRALVSLVLAAALLPIGLALIAKGVRWTRRLPLPATGPQPITPEEAVAVLVRREPPAFGDDPTAPYWVLRRFLADQLPDLTWWRRDLVGRGTRAFVRACGLATMVGVLDFALPYITPIDLLGPFPTSFMALLLFVTATWAALGLLLIPSDGPRIESFVFALPHRAEGRADPVRGPVIESDPTLLDREGSGLGVTLGILGALVQCLTVSWWTLSFIGYPHIATSITRHAESIAGGIVFLVLGERMLQSAAEMLLYFRYASTLVLVEENGEPGVGHGALVRTESKGLDGPRRVVAAVAGIHARESVEALMTLAPLA